MVLPSAGGTLSQLSDSGQTLSEDSGVDIAEAGGLRDGSPRPSKNQHGRAEQGGAHVAPPGTPRPVRPPSHMFTYGRGRVGIIT